MTSYGVEGELHLGQAVVLTIIAKTSTNTRDFRHESNHIFSVVSTI